MTPACPVCRKVLPATAINVASNIAYCADCNQGFPLSGLLTTDGTTHSPIDLTQPPTGCWYRELIDGWELGATLRHPIAFILVPFMLVWSGFSLGGIYGTQLMEQKFDLVRSLFGIPFVLGTFFLGGLTVLTIIGKTTITMIREEGSLFIGVGSLGWRRHFLRSDIDTIHEQSTSNGSSRFQVISLEGKRRLTFAQGLSDERRYFLLRALRHLFQNQQQKVP